MAHIAQCSATSVTLFQYTGSWVFLDMTFGSGLHLLKPKLHNLQPKCVVFTRRDLSSIISNMCDTDRLSHG